jgi:gamma-glutamyltranspeptidase
VDNYTFLNREKNMEISWEFPYPSQRMPLFARNVVATSQPLAAQAGLQMLVRGGNALDAALATAIALTVVEPTSNGIRSDAFALIWHKGKLSGFLFRRRLLRCLRPEKRRPGTWLLKITCRTH